MPRILIVEDDPVALELFRIILVLEQFDVDVATRAFEGSAMLSTRSYDAALIDLRLPDSSGLDLLRCHPSSGGQTPFVLMTAYGTVSSAVEAMRLGACDYLEKPLTDTVIVNAVRKAVGHSHTIELAEAAEYDSHPTVGLRAPQWPWRVVAALEVIEKRCSEPNLRLSMVAQELRISSAHLCRLLKHTTGNGYGLHLHRFRTIKAKTLLSTTHLTVKEIAWDCGYQNTTRLDHYFKRFYRVLPSVYRQRLRER